MPEPALQPQVFHVLSRVPVSAELTPTWVRGETANRLMVILRAPGCVYDLGPKRGCTYCGYRRLTTGGAQVPASDLVEQLEAALRTWNCDRDQIREIDLYNSGSFLNDFEIPEGARLRMLERCACEISVRVIVVESRPEYITPERLAAMRLAMRRPQPLSLEVGIGLDAFDSYVREKKLRKGFSLCDFERAVSVLGASGVDLLAYVMLKPTNMEAAEALHDVEEAANYIHGLARRYGISVRLALEPTFVVPETSLAREYLAGHYVPPSLWLVKKAVERIAPLGPVVVGLWDEGLQPLAVPSSCQNCRDRLVTILQLFNRTQDVSALDIGACECASSGHG